jgi:hypothetical protein
MTNEPSLPAKLLALAAFDGNRFVGTDQRRGGKREHERLEPLIQALVNVAGAAEEYVQTDGGEMYDRLNVALAELERLVEVPRD